MSFFGRALAAGSELRHRAQRGGLRHLAAGIGVHLGVEQQDVDVGLRRQHVVEPAVADVVAPAVATYNPHALLHQEVGDGKQIAARRRLVSCQLLFQLLHSLALREDAFLGGLICAQNFHSEMIADGRSHPLHQHLGVVVLFVDGQADAHAELGVIFEQRVRPGRPSAFGVHAVRRGRQVAAVDRRAAGRVADHCAVAEQPRHQRDVWRFAATCAGAGELEQRLQQLLVFHLPVRELLTRELWDLLEVIPPLVVLLAQRRLGLHVDGAMLGLALALRGTDRNAQAASGAIFRRHLQRVLQLGELAPLRHRRLESLRLVIDIAGIEDLGTNDRVRTNHNALATLDAQLLVPHRNLQRDVALLPLRGSCGESAVNRQRAHWNQVALTVDDQRFHVTHEVRRVGRNRADGCRTST